MVRANPCGVKPGYCLEALRQILHPKEVIPTQSTPDCDREHSTHLQALTLHRGDAIRMPLGSVARILFLTS